MTKITIESGSRADNRVMYARGPIDSLPLRANVDGIDVSVEMSSNEPNAVAVVLEYSDHSRWEEYSTGGERFDPVALDDLPAEFHEIVRVGISDDE